jgi:hypothetical protein
MAWGLSLVFVVVITTGVFVWQGRQVVSVTPATAVSDTDSLDALAIEAELSVWSQTGVFEELAQLETEEEENLRRILQTAEQETLEQK